MSFTTAGLSVSEASCHSAVKNALNQRFRRVVVHHLVIALVVERIIESERVVFQIFR